MSALLRFASSRRSSIIARLPARSPTMGLICESAIRMARFHCAWMSAAEPNGVEILLEDLVDPAAQALGWIVLGVKVAAGQRIELAGRERVHEQGRTLRRCPWRVVRKAPRHLRVHEAGTDGEDEDVP